MSIVRLAIFALILGAVVAALALLPSVAIDTQAVLGSSAWAYVRAALYFLPLHTVLAIVGVVLALGLWSIIVAAVKTIWDVLPFGG